MQIERKSTPEERAVFLAGLQGDADQFEIAGDVKGWSRAMRKLWNYAGWSEEPPESIPVTEEFFRSLLQEWNNASNYDLDCDAYRGLRFRRIYIHPEVLCNA